VIAVFPGSSLKCKSCGENVAATSDNLCQYHLDRQKEYQKKRHARLRAEGRCIRCGKCNGGNRTYCTRCVKEKNKADVAARVAPRGRVCTGCTISDATAPFVSEKLCTACGQARWANGVCVRHGIIKRRFRSKRPPLCPVCIASAGSFSEERYKTVEGYAQSLFKHIESCSDMRDYNHMLLLNEKLEVIINRMHYEHDLRLALERLTTRLYKELERKK